MQNEELSNCGTGQWGARVVDCAWLIVDGKTGQKRAFGRICRICGILDRFNIFFKKVVESGGKRWKAVEGELIVDG